MRLDAHLVVVALGDLNVLDGTLGGTLGSLQGLAGLLVGLLCILFDELCVEKADASALHDILGLTVGRDVFPVKLGCGRRHVPIRVRVSVAIEVATFLVVLVVDDVAEVFVEVVRELVVLLVGLRGVVLGVVQVLLALFGLLLGLIKGLGSDACILDSNVECLDVLVEVGPHLVLLLAEEGERVHVMHTKQK